MQMLRKLFRRFAEKNKQNSRKKSAEQRKILLIFSGFYGKKQLKNLLFLRFFEEILIPINAIIKHASYSTNPSVSRKNLKKVPKKVLT